MNKRIQSRKFIITMLLQAIATWMLFTGGCTFDEWSTFTMFITGTYTGANVIGHVTKSETIDPIIIDDELNGDLGNYNP